MNKENERVWSMEYSASGGGVLADQNCSVLKGSAALVPICPESLGQQAVVGPDDGIRL